MRIFISVIAVAAFAAPACAISPADPAGGAPPEAVATATSALSQYCSPTNDNLCNVSQLNRNCQTNDQWVQGYYDYQALCGSAGGVNFVCHRGVDNLCAIPELGLGCSGNDQWTKGWYGYSDLCQAPVCGAQPTTPTTLIGAGGTHPADARSDRELNILVTGHDACPAGAPQGCQGQFTAYGYTDPPDTHAVDLTNLWRASGQRPRNPPFGTQYVLHAPSKTNASWIPGFSGLVFPACGAVTLPSTGSPARDIGPGLQAMVMFAGATTLTLEYTLTDGDPDVRSGYTVYVENIDVNPNLILDYNLANLRGRGQLPALAENAVIGRARSGEIHVTIRDSGTYMDVRSRQDWWQTFTP